MNWKIGSWLCRRHAEILSPRVREARLALLGDRRGLRALKIFSGTHAFSSILLAATGGRMICFVDVGYETPDLLLGP